MPIHIRENQYLGINAHLHSYLQKYHEWSSFHSVYITTLACDIQEVFFNLGYIVLPENLFEYYLSSRLSKVRMEAR